MGRESASQWSGDDNAVTGPQRADQILAGAHPERVIEKAVERMLPKGPLGRQQIRKLHVYRGGEHPHQRQAPTALDLAGANRKNSVREASDG